MRKLLAFILTACMIFDIPAVPAEAASVEKPIMQEVISQSYNSMQIEWTEVEGASGYVIYRKAGSGKYKKIATVSADKPCTYTDKKLQTGTKYQYRIKAYEKRGKKKVWSSYSSSLSGQCQLDQPVILSVDSTKSGKLKITFKAVPGASGYVLYRSTDVDGPYKKIKTLSGRSYTDKKANSTETFYYKVKAYRKVNGAKRYSADSSVRSSDGLIQTSTFEEFSADVSELVKNYGTAPGSTQVVDPYLSGRLIVRSSGAPLDFSEIGAVAVLSGLDDVYLVQFASGAEARKAANEIGGWDDVVYVEPDALDTVGANEDVSTASFNSWGVTRIGADRYAERVSEMSSGTVKVAVVDSGVSKHSFIRNRLTSDGRDYVDNDSDPSDPHGHGTHVSGTIVDCTPNLNVKVMPVRVLGADGRGSHSVIGTGIRYAADNGAKVINLSLGGPHSSFMDECINYAVNKGVTVVVAAGNESSNIEKWDICPAHLRNVICVGAIDSEEDRAYFSNYGNALDVAAPGVGIKSCVPSGGYDSWDGTSMAAPHVSALAAMLKLAHPSYSPAQIEQTIKDNTKDLGSRGWDQYYGYGMPDFSEFEGVREPEDISLDEEELFMETGETYTLRATVEPDDAADKTVTWSSSDTDVASVNRGTVTAKSAGTATITARTVNGKTATCAVTVTEPEIEPTGITLNESRISLETGETYTLRATVEPDDAADKTVTWSSSDTDVASVSSGTVTAKSAGTATITARTVNGKTAACRVTVTEPEIEPTGIVLNESRISLETGETYTLYATVEPDDAADKTVTWSSSDTDVASVSSGTVTAKSAGTATITARTVNGKTATCRVTVTEPKPQIPGTDIWLNYTKIGVGVGMTRFLSATVTPSDATVIWESSDSNVVEVSQSGSITGSHAGTATITARTINGLSASCQCVVLQIETDRWSYTCKKGDVLEIHAKITLDRAPQLNDRRYVLYFAYQYGGWQEMGSYNIDGSSYLNKRWDSPTEIADYTIDGNVLNVTLRYDTSNTSDVSEVPVGERMFALSIFPYDNFATGGSLLDYLFFVKITE